jgi:hypothetical protein
MKKILNAGLFLFIFLFIGCITPADNTNFNQGTNKNLASEPTEEKLKSSPIIKVTPQATKSVRDNEIKNKSETSPFLVGKWKRFEVVLSNPSWSGNPFDLDLIGNFEHTPTGKIVKQLGFYAGDNTWKIYFMPDLIGEWTYKTQSTDEDLHGLTGSLNCIESGLPGKLIGNGKRWLFEDSHEYVSPILLPTREWFKRSNTSEGIDEFIQWADETTGALIIGTTLVYFHGAQDEIPYVKGQEGELFNIPMWDRLNSHYDMMRDRGMGLYIMFYSDDEESPNRHNILPKSPEELRLFKYAVARFSAYPIVMWDTGIDIRETRKKEWIDWFTNWFNANDPWRHPVSSRTGGGSGGKFPENGTYYSDGASELPPHKTVVGDWMSREVPTAYTDRWRENYRRGEFDRDGIRRAVWEIGLVGGSAVYIGGNENDGYLNENYATDLEAASDLGFRNQFFRKKIIDFGSLTPSDNLLMTGQGVILAANKGREYVVYDYDGGSFSINFKDANEPLNVRWFNPRTGELIKGEMIHGGESHSFLTPTKDDWVLHVFK